MNRTRAYYLFSPLYRNGLICICTLVLKVCGTEAQYWYQVEQQALNPAFYAYPSSSVPHNFTDCIWYYSLSVVNKNCSGTCIFIGWEGLLYSSVSLYRTTQSVSGRRIAELTLFYISIVNWHHSVQFDTNLVSVLCKPTKLYTRPSLV